MEVLMLGIYKFDTQPKSMTIAEGLKQHSVSVEIFTDQSKLKYLKIIRKLLTAKYDVIFATGHFVLLLSKLFSRKPVLYDIFISAHDTLVLDRKMFKEKSILAKIIFFLDKLTCRLADVVTIDTEAYADYFVKSYGLDPMRVRVIYLGSYEKKFYPRKPVKKPKGFVVEYHGGFIPVHGTEYMIRAAKVLEGYKDIKFAMIGKGQEWERMKSLAHELNLKNITFPGRLPDEELFKNIANSDVCLGMFGTTEKCPRTVSNKVFEYMAMKKAFITADSPATREFLTSEKNCLLCETGNPEALASAILRLKKNQKLRSKIAENSYKLFKERFSVEKTGLKAKEVLEYTVEIANK